MKNIVQYSIILLFLVVLHLSYAKPSTKPKGATINKTNKSNKILSGAKSIPAMKNVTQNKMMYCPSSQHIPHGDTFKNLYLLCDKDSIFRSKQPLEDDFKWLLDTFKIKSILKLNEENPNDFGYLDNPNIIGKYYLPMKYKDVAFEETNKIVVEAISILKTAPKPILIHCTAGVDRTGLIIALYKMLFYDCGKDTAYNEMIRLIKESHAHDSDFVIFSDFKAYFDSVSVDSLKTLKKQIFDHQIINSNLETLGFPQEYSGITSFNDSLYLLEEKNHKIVVVDNENYKISRTIDLNNKGLNINNAQFEAITVFKNHFFITSEECGNVKIYDYNLTKNTLSDITPTSISNDCDLFGIEGIAINQKKKICYILKERNENYSSVIKEYDIIRDKYKKINLVLKDSVTIKHVQEKGKEAKDNWRYSDIFYDSETKQVLCLKSFHDGDSSKYQIDTLQTNKSGYIGIKIFEINKLKLYKDISKEVMLHKKNNENISTNLEGITILHNTIYLISDDCQCPDGKREHTLFLRLLKN